MYRSFKDVFGKEKYLFSIDIYCFRVALTQVRLGVLPLNNNLHRYSENPVERICIFCADAFENKQHFIYTCPLYSDVRKRFLEKYSAVPLCKLIEGKNEKIGRSVAKFVFHAMKRRQQYIESED